MDGSLERSSSFYAGISRSAYTTSTPDPIRSRFPPPTYREPPEQNPVILQQNVSAWFSNLKQNRQMVAAGFAGASSILISAIFVFLVNFSIWAPFSTLKSGIVYLFSLKFLLMSAISWIFYFLMANFFIQSIFSVSYETYLNLKRLENVLVFFVWLFSHAFFGFILNSLMLTDFWLSSSSISVLLFISTALSAYRIAFESNFRLTFPVNELSKKRFILSCFGVSRGSDLQAKVFRSFHIVKWAWLISLNISILLSHVRLTFWDLFSPRSLFNVFLFVVYQQLMAYFVISFVKIFTMEPLKLQMPSPYFAAESFLSNKPNLIHALTNEDALFKMFGMKNLRDSTMKDPKEQQEVYTLSQPGGHPRNWNSIRDVCLAILRQISSHLEAENVSMQAGNSKFISSLTAGIENPNRAALLLPPTLKPRFLGAPGIPQSKPLSPLAAFLKPYVEKIQAWYFMDPPVITTYESIMAQYAIESLYLLAMNAFKEDTYGVVQRDLAKIVTIFLDFEVNIDTFIRAKNLNPFDKRSISSIQDIESVLTEALCKLYVQYQDHIDTLNLTKDQLDLWELLVRE